MEFKNLERNIPGEGLAFLALFESIKAGEAQNIVGLRTLGWISILCCFFFTFLAKNVVNGKLMLKKGSMPRVAYSCINALVYGVAIILDVLFLPIPLHY